MVDFNLIADLGVDDAEIDALLQTPEGDDITEDTLENMLAGEIQQVSRGRILTGKIAGRAGDDAVVDVGLKSEGLVHKSEFDDWDAIKPGDEIEVLLEEFDDGSGVIKLSKRKADRIRGWERVLETKNEGDIVEGRGVRKIKGGLLVDIGVPVFLPASQIDVRRPGDVGEFIGKIIRAEILKIDEERRNIVISRRRVLERERSEAKDKILSSLEEGGLIKGVVTNIADFGAFIDLGGIDGLLHITDMSWGRVSHPSEICKPGDELEVKVLRIDREKEKIAHSHQAGSQLEQCRGRRLLGTASRQPPPWSRQHLGSPTG